MNWRMYDGIYGFTSTVSILCSDTLLMPSAALDMANSGVNSVNWPFSFSLSYDDMLLHPFTCACSISD